LRYDKCRVRRVRQLGRRPSWTPERSAGGPEGTRRDGPTNLSRRTIFNELAALFFIAVLFTSAALVPLLRVGLKENALCVNLFGLFPLCQTHVLNIDA